MRSSVAIRVLTASVVVVSVMAWAGVSGQESSTRPPAVKQVGEHWSAWDPPPAGPDAYIIQKGDTLWAVAERWLGDPFLWPQVWDENRYVLDSHWIYPGDPLVIPGRPTVVPEEGPPPVAETPTQPDTGEDVPFVRQVEVAETGAPDRWTCVQAAATQGAVLAVKAGRGVC